MPQDRLKEHIRGIIQIPEADLEAICACFQPQTVEKGTFLLRHGQICNFEGFVLEGCFRTFIIDEAGRENILHFSVRDWWLMDIDSFMNRRPSDLNIQALETSKVLLISQSDKQSLYQEVPIVEKLFRGMFQKALVAWQRRLIRNHCLTAKERYHHFINTYPEISSKLTDRQIASYLGITHEFLSKIKREIRTRT
ncbi:MAG: Crp/Fnr family transcriptional regulator [Saprospiraceae bacterium]|nr:Crp/Fnr family transcriptional regulator [Saprospiraceae bacterium]